MEKLRVLDLFSGIGGFSLGLERTGGFETVAFCEIDPFCRNVLAKHWPKVPIYEDVRTLTGEQVETIDVITGGFPCQDVSIAGYGRGIEAERSGLWTELHRIIGEIRPSYAVVENVTGLLSGPVGRPGNWFGRVLGDLAALGYDSEWHCIPTAVVGAPHIRDRVWLVAYPQQESGFTSILTGNNGAERERVAAQAERHPDGLRLEMGSALRSISGEWMDQPDSARMVDGVSDWPHRLGAIGNAVVPAVVEIIGNAILETEAAE